MQLVYEVFVLIAYAAARNRQGGNACSCGKLRINYIACPRALASMAALPSPLELMLPAKAIMEVVLPEPKNPMVTIYFVVIIYSS